MVDRVLDVAAGYLDLEADAILGQLLDDRLHPAYLSKGVQVGRACLSGRSAMPVRAEGLEPPRAFAHQVLSLARIPVSPRPRFRIVPASEDLRMADREQREQESLEDPETKFQEQRDEERAERERLAEGVEDDEPES